jgi:hypothetical protein
VRPCYLKGATNRGMIQRCLLMARNGHGAMSDLSPLSGVKRKSKFGAATSVIDPNRTLVAQTPGARSC